MSRRQMIPKEAAGSFSPSAARAQATTRCAIYTRKSTEEGLDQAYTTLESQRDSCLAYIASQQQLGWVPVADRYDDGGFSGGNTDRPALQRLLRDIEVGKIDCVLVYKIDRLSRSLIDFGRLIELFEKHSVALVAVTQQINTASSMGRLMLNVLLSFAQFEREVIAERTRDKLSAMRRKGMWTGGLAPLGYDIDRATSTLRVNDLEAERVREIFRMYAEAGSLLPVVERLDELGWTNKLSKTKQGELRGGRPFTRTSLHRLLTNPIVVGKIRLHEEVHDGQHPAIVDIALFREVQDRLSRNGQTGGHTGGQSRNPSPLKGLLRCKACQSAMTPTFTAKGTKRYRYYQCGNASKSGHARCPAGTIPANPVEEFVIGKLRGIGRDPELTRETIAQVHAQDEARLVAIDSSLRLMSRERLQAEEEIRTLPPHEDQGEPAARLRVRILKAEEEIDRLSRERASLKERRLDDAEIDQALRQFDDVWASLTPTEQHRLVALMLDKVEYDAHQGTLELQFHSHGIESLARQLPQ
jgi:site-specific DNA recombinase